MRIGPGMAPKALLYALKVFGCPTGGAGRRCLRAPALDWALDPNGDGNFSDHLDVVNISLGGDYSDRRRSRERDRPQHHQARRDAGLLRRQRRRLLRHRRRAGAPEALSVASVRDAFELLDAIEVTAPAGIAGNKPGQYSVAFDYEGVNVTGQVVKMTDPANLDGCLPFSPADAAIVAGKFVWLEWDDNDATRRCGSVGRSGNAVAAGATGALFTSTLEHFAAGITGSAVIPVFQMTGPVTNELRPSLDAGTLVRPSGRRSAQRVPFVDPDIEDTPSSFTSRGTRTPGVKPDVAAPGDTIVSTAIGTGNEQTSISGTSMASPARGGHRGAHPPGASRPGRPTRSRPPSWTRPPTTSGRRKARPGRSRPRTASGPDVSTRAQRSATSSSPMTRAPRPSSASGSASSRPPRT